MTTASILTKCLVLVLTEHATRFKTDDANPSIYFFMKNGTPRWSENCPQGDGICYVLKQSELLTDGKPDEEAILFYAEEINQFFDKE